MAFAGGTPLLPTSSWRTSASRWTGRMTCASTHGKGYPVGLFFVEEETTVMIAEALETFKASQEAPLQVAAQLGGRPHARGV